VRPSGRRLELADVVVRTGRFDELAAKSSSYSPPSRIRRKRLARLSGRY